MLKRIVPLGCHDAIAPSGEVAKVLAISSGAAAPSAAIFQIEPRAKEPICLLSGDQNGAHAPTVPFRIRHEVSLSLRTMSTFPSRPNEAYVSIRASGDSAMRPAA